MKPNGEFSQKERSALIEAFIGVSTEVVKSFIYEVIDKHRREYPFVQGDQDDPMRDRLYFLSGFLHDAFIEYAPNIEAKIRTHETTTH